MTTIKEKDLFDAKTLLEQRQLATDALEMMGKSAYHVTVVVMHEDDNDSMEVELNYGIAKKAVESQLAQIDADLEKLDLRVV